MTPSIRCLRSPERTAARKPHRPPTRPRTLPNSTTRKQFMDQRTQKRQALSSGYAVRIDSEQHSTARHRKHSTRRRCTASERCRCACVARACGFPCLRRSARHARRRAGRLRRTTQARSGTSSRPARPSSPEPRACGCMRRGPAQRQGQGGREEGTWRGGRGWAVVLGRSSRGAPELCYGSVRCWPYLIPKHASSLEPGREAPQPAVPEGAGTGRAAPADASAQPPRREGRRQGHPALALSLL